MSNRATQVVLRRHSARKLNVDSIKRTIESVQQRILTEGRVKAGWTIEETQVDLVTDENTAENAIKHHYEASFLLHQDSKRERRADVLAKDVGKIKAIISVRCNRLDWELAFREVEVKTKLSVTKVLYETPVVKYDPKDEVEVSDETSTEKTPEAVVDETVVESAVNEPVAV